MPSVLLLSAVQLNLVPHPATPPSQPGFKLWANVDHAAAFGAAATVNIWFGVGAPASRFVLPEADEPSRADELWRTTCFEAFLREEGADGYSEWNFAPSGQWAAYDFIRPRGYGRGSTSPLRPTSGWRTISPGGRLEPRFRSMLEKAGSSRSRRSLRRRTAPSPTGRWPMRADKPDFHHPDCFVAKLP